MKEEGEGSIRRSQWNVSGVADGIQFNVELEAAEIPHPSKFWAYTSSSPDNLAYWSILLERAPMKSNAPGTLSNSTDAKQVFRLRVNTALRLTDFFSFFPPSYEGILTMGVRLPPQPLTL
jgi:hypothetical protein